MKSPKAINDFKVVIGDILNRNFVCKAYGILGFPKFVDGYYLLLMVGRKIIANINNKFIYTITQTRVEFISNQVLIKNYFDLITLIENCKILS